VITHYHGDHVGGAADLAARVPIRQEHRLTCPNNLLGTFDVFHTRQRQRNGSWASRAHVRPSRRRLHDDEQPNRFQKGLRREVTRCR
jgi:glyoxylase-like metal-dependent hydrolase (beta-lactamase superfamily II)